MQKSNSEKQYEVERSLRIDVASKTTEIEQLRKAIETTREERRMRENFKATICATYNKELDSLMKEVVIQRKLHGKLFKTAMEVQRKAIRVPDKFNTG